MSSKLNKVGHLEIDHRYSPGLDAELAHRVGLGGMPVGAGTVFKCDTYTCSHCQTVVIINPLRKRDRAWCARCDRYICDGCGAAMAVSGVCKPFAKIAEEVQEAAAKRGTEMRFVGVSMDESGTATVSLHECPVCKQMVQSYVGAPPGSLTCFCIRDILKGTSLISGV